ncbi:hypothetical protein VNO78_25121 [Psophocarpus tetragonolobus]|uniref:Uncharacterized protein n=1 Tax=Psophocarpus tetragonolobus TaxID=3891 RepID=A0AAN9S6I3_PSOTE
MDSDGGWTKQTPGHIQQQSSGHITRQVAIHIVHAQSGDVVGAQSCRRRDRSPKIGQFHVAGLASLDLDQPEAQFEGRCGSQQERVLGQRANGVTDWASNSDGRPLGAHLDFAIWAGIHRNWLQK